MNLTPVISGNVRAFGYDPSTATLRIAFRSGGVYDHFNVHPSLAEAMHRPHPWRRVGESIKAHLHRRVQ